MRLPSLSLVALLVGACSTRERPGIYSPDAGGGASGPSVLGGELVADAGPACIAGSALYCEAQTPYRCVNGQRVAEAACAGDRPFCAGGAGCVVCLPTTERCDPSRPEVPQRCADDGGRWIDGAACDVAAGRRCGGGRCGDPCAPQEGARQYLGCEYWASVTPNSQLSRSFPFAVALANPQPYPVEVRISGGALDEPRAITLAAGAAEAVTLPWVDALGQMAARDLPCTCGSSGNCGNARLARSALARGGAYHVEATAPVAAYQFNPLTFQTTNAAGVCLNSFTNDASLLLSQRALTRRYRVVTAANWVPTAGVVIGGFVAIVATTGESTSVTVRLPARHGVAEAIDGTLRYDNLTPGDVALVVGSQSGDLSGAEVEASNPVAVFAGHDCTNLPQGTPACDHLEEQVLPLETLGQDFVLTDLRDRAAPTLVRMVAVSDETVVRFDPATVSAPRRLSAGQVIEVSTSDNLRISASRPLQVAQFMTGLGLGAQAVGGAGDPAMVTEVPTQQFRDRYDIFVPATYTSNFLGVVAPRGARVLLDEAPLEGEREPLGPWDIVHARVTPGRHALRAVEGVPFGVKVYGTALYTSYMYPGGLDLRLLTPG